MTFFSPHPGQLGFLDRLRLRAGMPVRDIEPHLRHAGGPAAAYCLPGLAVDGGSLAAVCLADEAGLCSVRLTVAAVTGRQQVPGERQRAFLFERFGLKDPCPDTLQNVRVKGPFGHLTLYTDPVTGQAGALVEYARP